MKTYNISVCVYEGGPAVAVETGESGVRYGLCADCKAHHDKQQMAAPHIAVMENFRSSMRAAGLASPGVERFADHMVLLLSVTADPKRCMDTILEALDGADEKHLQTAGSAS
jgi:hypothetical protein